MGREKIEHWGIARGKEEEKGGLRNRTKELK